MRSSVNVGLGEELVESFSEYRSKHNKAELKTTIGRKQPVGCLWISIRFWETGPPGKGGLLPISSDRDDRKIFGGLKFSTSFGKYFFG